MGIVQYVSKKNQKLQLFDEIGRQNILGQK